MEIIHLIYCLCVSSFAKRRPRNVCMFIYTYMFVQIYVCRYVWMYGWKFIVCIYVRMLYIYLYNERIRVYAFVPDRPTQVWPEALLLLLTYIVNKTHIYTLIRNDTCTFIRNILKKDYIFYGYQTMPLHISTVGNELTHC